MNLYLLCKRINKINIYFGLNVFGSIGSYVNLTSSVPFQLVKFEIQQKLELLKVEQVTVQIEIS